MAQKANEPSGGPSRSPNGAIDPGLVTADDTRAGRDALGRIRRPGHWTVLPSQVARGKYYMRCSLQARHLYLIAWLYANRERTDGTLHMPDFRNVAAETQLSEREAEDVAGELVQANLWTGRLPGPGYELVDFLAWNYSAQEIDHKAELARERMRKHDGKKGFSDSSKETATQATQATQEENALGNALPSNGDVANATTNGAAHGHDLEATRPAEDQAQRWKDLLDKGQGNHAKSAVP